MKEIQGQTKLLGFKSLMEARLQDNVASPRQHNPAGCLFTQHFLCAQEKLRKQDFTDGRNRP